VPAGEPFDDRQIDDMVHAARGASERTGFGFSVFIGCAQGDPRVYADRLLVAANDPTDAVLVFVEPAARSVEVRTGQRAARHLDDRTCGLAAMSMASSFTGGDIVGGVVTGLRMLSEGVVV
jgi:hypothetical protein